MISDMQFLEKGDGRSLRDTVYKELKEAICAGISPRTKGLWKSR